MSTLVSTQTPLRVSFVGGGTDLPEISEEIGGAVLNMAIRQYVYVTVKRHSGLFDDNYRLQYSSTERCSNIGEIKNDIIRTSLEYFNITSPLVINTMSDIPASSGLGSSSSFTVGLVKALNTMFSLGIATSAIAEVAFKIERSINGSSVGRQDIYAAATGGMNLFEFDTKQSISPVHNCNQICEELLPSMKLVWTGIQRSASKILSNQINQFKEHLDEYNGMKELSVGTYKRLCEFPENISSILAEAININRDYKYKLSNKIVSKEILLIENELKGKGAIATKLLGAGGGGFILALFCNKEQANTFVESNCLVNLPVELDSPGTRVTQNL